MNVTRRAAAAALCFLATSLPTAAAAATSQVTASGFLVTHAATLKAPPREVFAAIGQVGKWWDSEHTYSRRSTHLSLVMRAGGCFCEHWDGNSVEHARVLLVARDRLLRLEGALGPLQEMGVHGLLQFRLAAAAEDRTTLTVTYRVRGGADAALDRSAAHVDRVLGEQVTRLVRFVETGEPVAKPPPKPLEDRFFQAPGGVRLRYLDEGGGADPVVLIHDEGVGIDAQWVESGVLPSLVRQDIFRVIAPELRGHGKSAGGAAATGEALAGDVLALLAHLDIPRAHVVGYGLGANIALYLAARHPERVITLTLAGGGRAPADAAGARAGLALSDEQVRAVSAPTLGIIGEADPARGELIALRPLLPRLWRLTMVEGATHAAAPRDVEFVNAIQYFLRYHPARLVK